MTILLQIEIFPFILKKLPLNDLIVLRRVCQQWKQWIDDYLKQQKTLLLAEEDNEVYKRLTPVSQTLDINYNKILFNKLLIDGNRKWNRRMTDSLIQTFPELEELYICVGRQCYTQLDYESFLWDWKYTLRKLILPGFSDKQSNQLAECINKCNKIETFGILEHQLEDYDYWNSYSNPNSIVDPSSNKSYDPSFIENEQYLTRLKAVWLPLTRWIFRYPSFPNIAGIVGIVHKQVLSNRFPNVQKVFLEFLFFPATMNQDKSVICRRLQELAELGNGNLCCLEFEIMCLETGMLPNGRWNSEKFYRINYPPFAEELNRLTGVKTLKFEFSHPVFLEYVLKNCANFDHVETLIINYKTRYNFHSFDGTVLHLPANFLELLPRMVNRIQNVEFHLEQQNGERFRRAMFSNLPYRVKIFHDL